MVDRQLRAHTRRLRAVSIAPPPPHCASLRRIPPRLSSLSRGDGLAAPRRCGVAVALEQPRRLSAGGFRRSLHRAGRGTQLAAPMLEVGPWQRVLDAAQRRRQGIAPASWTRRRGFLRSTRKHALIGCVRIPAWPHGSHRLRDSGDGRVWDGRCSTKSWRWAVLGSGSCGATDIKAAGPSDLARLPRDSTLLRALGRLRQVVHAVRHLLAVPLRKPCAVGAFPGTHAMLSTYSARIYLSAIYPIHGSIRVEMVFFFRSCRSLAGSPSWAVVLARRRPARSRRDRIKKAGLRIGEDTSCWRRPSDRAQPYPRGRSTGGAAIFY